MLICAYRKLRIVFFFVFSASLTFLNAQPVSNRPDISIKQLATVQSSSVRIKKDPVSGNLYILQNNGDIQRVNFSADSSVTFTLVYTSADHGLSAPLGMAFGQDGTIYLAGNEISDTNSAYATCDIVKGVPDAPGSENRTWSFIATSEEYTFGHVYNHKTNAVAVDPNGEYIYVNNGACTDHGEIREGHREVGLTSVILKLPTDSTNIMLKNDRKWLREHGFVMAEGIRNTFGLAYSANGDLFGVENSDDRDDPDEMNWIREGHHYGFPWIIGGDVTPQQFPGYDPHSDPLLSPNAWGGGNGMLYQTYSNDSTYPPPPDSVTFTAPIRSVGPDADIFRDTATGTIKDASELGDTIETFTPHSSPDGIVFDKDSILAGDLKGGAFVIRYEGGGLLVALGDTGDDLLHVSLKKVNDNYVAKVTQLVKGFKSPLGIELAGNKLFVMETGYYSNFSPKLYEIILPVEKTVSVNDSKNLPGTFILNRNYPNPFNPATRISFSLPKTMTVTLSITNILGQTVAEPINNEVLGTGKHEIDFDGSNLSSGIYLYTLKGDGYEKSHAMVLLK